LPEGDCGVADARQGKTLVAPGTLIDKARIHKGDIMERKRRQWARHGLYLHYLPPYSPELNRIEILWKQAKYFGRRFVSLRDIDLVNEVNSIMNRFGSEFMINFA
jgi:transposase